MFLHYINVIIQLLRSTVDPVFIFGQLLPKNYSLRQSLSVARRCFIGSVPLSHFYRRESPFQLFPVRNSYQMAGFFLHPLATRGTSVCKSTRHSTSDAGQDSLKQKQSLPSIRYANNIEPFLHDIQPRVVNIDQLPKASQIKHMQKERLQKAGM